MIRYLLLAILFATPGFSEESDLIRNGQKIHYRMEGKGEPAIFFVQDSSLTAFAWEFQFAALSSDFRCVVIERNPALDFEDMRYVIKALQLKKPILVGHSDGGLMVMRFAIKYPDELCKLVLAGSSSEKMEDLKGIKVPTLIIFGSSDSISPFSTSAYLRSNIPRSQLLELPTGHNMMYTAWRPFNEALRSFIKPASCLDPAGCCQ